MKKTTLLKSMLLLCALVVRSNSLWATEGDILSETFEAKLSGWTTSGKTQQRDTGAKHNGSYGYLFGSAGGNTGIVTTPALSSLSGKATLTFWAKTKTSGSVAFTISGTNCSVSGDTNINPTTTWTQYTVDITGGSSTSKITFSKAGSETVVVYMDDVMITSVSSSISKPSIYPVNGTTISGSQTVTISQAESKDVYYTIDGSTPSSTSTKYTGSFSVSASQITGEVTVKAIAIDGSDESDIATATYVDTSIQPLSVNIDLNNTFFGCSAFTSWSTGDPTSYTASKKNISVTYAKGSGNFYITAEKIRYYTNNTFRIEAPSGYVLTQVVFSADISDATEGNCSDDTWTGAASSVDYSFANKTDLASVSVTLAQYQDVTPGYNKITYVTPDKMDFSNVTGLKAYVATAASGSGVTMTPVGAVPAGTPLLLVATASTTYKIPIAVSADAPATNKLVAGDGTTDMSGVSGFNYILYSDGLFYQVTSGTIAATKAYLHLDSAPGAHTLDIIFDESGEATGITEVTNGQQTKANGQYFNLAGQRVNTNHKGIVIVNGKKYFNK